MNDKFDGFIMETIVLEKDGLELILCIPDLQEGYYRGTRFDHSGIFRRIVKEGYVFADEWFDVHDPYKHDAVPVPSQEIPITTISLRLATRVPDRRSR